MLADNQTLQRIVTLVDQLSPEYRLRLIQHITETLIPTTKHAASQPLEYGKYHSDSMSTLEDFNIAEWWPTDTDFDAT